MGARASEGRTQAFLRRNASGRHMHAYGHRKRPPKLDSALRINKLNDKLSFKCHLNV